MVAFENRRESAQCPLMRPEISKDEARRASVDCRVECRFRVDGHCECHVVDIRADAKRTRSAS